MRALGKLYECSRSTESDDEDSVVDSAARAQELEGVRDAAHVELHGVGVEADRDGPILGQPLRHLRLILGDFNAARHARHHTGPRESNEQGDTSTGIYSCKY